MNALSAPRSAWLGRAAAHGSSAQGLWGFCSGLGWFSNTWSTRGGTEPHTAQSTSSHCVLHIWKNKSRKKHVEKMKKKNMGQSPSNHEISLKEGDFLMKFGILSLFHTAFKTKVLMFGLSFSSMWTNKIKAEIPKWSCYSRMWNKYKVPDQEI